MDNDSKDILRDLRFLYSMFVVFFIGFTLIFTITTVKIANNINAFGQCQGVPDSKFTECYNNKR